jgi:hypothetical protein
MENFLTKKKELSKEKRFKKRFNNPNWNYYMHRFSLGLPVEYKPCALETELGLVVFEEKFVTGFDGNKPPLSLDDAKCLLVESARRYALLTAFVAAEQRISIQSLVHKNSIHTGNFDPREMLQICARIEKRQSAAKNIIYSLAGQEQQDLEKIIMASHGYERYMLENQRQLLKGKMFHNEHNLNYARQIVKTQMKTNNIIGCLEIPDIKKPSDILYSDDRKIVDPAEEIIKSIGIKKISRLDNPGARPPETPFLEKYESGIAINLDRNKSIEILNRYVTPVSFHQNPMWHRQIRRVVVDENGERLVVAVYGFNGFSERFPHPIKKVFFIAPNFEIPLDPNASLKRIVGFKKRSHGGHGVDRQCPWV